MPNKPVQYRHGEQTTERQFQQLRDFISNLNNIPFLTGRLIEDIELDGTNQLRIPHGLEKKYQGWFVVKGPVGNQTRIEEVAHTDTGRYLILNSQNAVTISIWVF